LSTNLILNDELKKSQIKILTKARGQKKKNVNQIWKEKNKWRGEIEKENKLKNYLKLKN